MNSLEYFFLFVISNLQLGYYPLTGFVTSIEPLHNTLPVNDLDQSTQLSNFQWSEDIIAHSLVKPTKHGEYVYCSFARHHGFQSVGAIHYRAILINLLGELLVWDHVAGSGKLEVVANWHFATKVRANKRCFETNVAGINVGIKTSASATELFRESESPIAGWCSSAYGEKHGIDTLRLSERGSETVSLLTRFVFDAIDESDAWWETHIEELGKLI